MAANCLHQARSAASLNAGVAVADITPPRDVGLLVSSVQKRWAQFESVRRPLKARVLALECSGQMVVLATLDLLGLNGRAVGGWRQFKRALTKDVAGLTPARVVLTCTHTHTSPESMALTDLHRTAPFRAWIKAVEGAVAHAISRAVASVKPCTVAVASTELHEFSLQRRIPIGSEIKMSDGLQPIPLEWFHRQPVDHRVRAIILRDLNGTRIATLGHAVCHPVHEMILPHVSPDFPGEFCAALDATSKGGLSIFLNGTAGDVNPPTVSEGARAAIRHGKALARAVSAACELANEIPATTIQFRRSFVALPTRSLNGRAARRRCTAHLSGLAIGPLALLFMPGEIFVQTGKTIEKQSPFPTTLITSLAESSIGYVPTARAFREGGYEIGPGKWSFLDPKAEPRLVKAAVELLQGLRSPGAKVPFPRRLSTPKVIASAGKAPEQYPNADY